MIIWTFCDTIWDENYILKPKIYRNLGKGIEEKEHEVLRRRYLLIYGLGALGDWLQGPYVYRLYSLHDLKG